MNSPISSPSHLDSQKSIYICTTTVNSRAPLLDNAEQSPCRSNYQDQLTTIGRYETLETTYYGSHPINSSTSDYLALSSPSGVSPLSSLSLHSSTDPRNLSLQALADSRSNSQLSGSTTKQDGFSVDSADGQKFIPSPPATIGHFSVGHRLMLAKETETGQTISTALGRIQAHQAGLAGDFETLTPKSRQHIDLKIKEKEDKMIRRDYEQRKMNALISQAVTKGLGLQMSGTLNLENHPAGFAATKSDRNDVWNQAIIMENDTTNSLQPLTNTHIQSCQGNHAQRLLFDDIKKYGLQKTNTLQVQHHELPNREVVVYHLPDDQPAYHHYSNEPSHSNTDRKQCHHCHRHRYRHRHSRHRQDGPHVFNWRLHAETVESFVGKEALITNNFSQQHSPIPLVPRDGRGEDPLMTPPIYTSITSISETSPDRNAVEIGQFSPGVSLTLPGEACLTSSPPILHSAVATVAVSPSPYGNAETARLPESLCQPTLVDQSISVGDQVDLFRSAGPGSISQLNSREALTQSANPIFVEVSEMAP
ncbi:unnamed protein product [Protopolystoma xenopodis]|uniref:Uncharacterized protein n=1 Tax=Protopolystoma xenopodis TaxID=117903 RepID=A0A448XBZ9_9PLAT|nr:unnamed protein product [Protopolystoma xenopodis]